MSRGGSRGSAGTLRRLGPKPATRRRQVRPANCTVEVQGSYLTSIDPERQPVLTTDRAQALPLPAEEARQVCLAMRELGYDAEVVPVPRGGG